MEPTIGTNVKCINDQPLPGNDKCPPITLGKTYPIKNIVECRFCHSKHYDLGFTSELNYIRCYDCKSELLNPEIHWCHPSRVVAAE